MVIEEAQRQRMPFGYNLVFLNFLTFFLTHLLSGTPAGFMFKKLAHIFLYHLYGHEFEQALGVGDGQGSLVCCSPWGCKELDMAERLN